MQVAINGVDLLSEWSKTSGNEPVPSGWRLVRLGEVSEHCLGKMLDQQKQINGKWLPYLRNPNVQWLEFDLGNLEEMPFQSHELTRYEIKNGDVIVCEGGEPGRAAIWSGGGTEIKFQKALHRVRPSAALLDRFLVRRLQFDAYTRRLNWYFTGTTIKHFTGQDLHRYLFPLPPLPEQRRIVAILDKADAIRRKREESIRLTEELLRSTFLEMFGDPATNPKKWEVVTLGCTTNLVTSGLTPTGGSTVYINQGPIFIRSQNVQMNRLDLSDVACLPVAIHESMSRTKVANGDVLLNITGASIGRVTWVDKLPAEANVNQHVCIMRLQEDKATPEFISVFISLPFGQRQIDNMQSGASRQGLNHQQVRALRIPLPPLKLQQRYSTFVSKLRRLSNEREQGRTASDELFNSLVKRAFRGEL